MFSLSVHAPCGFLSLSNDTRVKINLQSKASKVRFNTI